MMYLTWRKIVCMQSLALVIIINIFYFCDLQKKRKKLAYVDEEIISKLKFIKLNHILKNKHLLQSEYIRIDQDLFFIKSDFEVSIFLLTF